MFAFKIWGKFGSFKDPMTISQNITVDFPPKTAVCGMLAAILGVDNFLKDREFSDFTYSIVFSKSIAKKSFSQNYINDYTEKTNSKLDNLQKLNFINIKDGLRDIKAPQKPINRELLINPSYLIFINNFKFKNEIIHNLKNRIIKYSLYMGNSEFAANFKFLEIEKYDLKNFDEVMLDSFVEQDLVSKIEFEDNVLYKNNQISTKLNEDRSPISFLNLINSSSKIKLKNIKAYEIKIKDEIYICRFV